MKGMEIRQLIAMILWPAIVSCSRGDSLCETGNRLEIGELEVRSKLLQILQSEGIPFELHESGAICYPTNKADFVLAKRIEIDLERNPPNQITIEGGDLARRVQSRLDQEGITYTTRTIENGKVVLSVEPSEANRAFEIAAEVAQSLGN